MSSFRRNHSTKAASASKFPIGFHPSHYNGVPTASTGIASLDDVLGGGLPISSNLLIDEDLDGSYARLILRYWIAQGIASHQHVIIVGSSLDVEGDPERVVERLMSIDDRDEDSSKPDSKTQPVQGSNPSTVDSDDDEITNDPNSKHMKIAWRYEHLGKHQAESVATYQQEARCHLFDLSKTMKLPAEQRSHIHCIDASKFEDSVEVLDEINNVIKKIKSRFPQNSPALSFRLAVQAFGSAGWPPSSPPGFQTMFRFLKALEYLLQTTTAAVCMVTFPSVYYPPRLRQMLPWAVSGYMSLESFAGNERSQIAFPNHQGAVDFIKLPCSASLLPPATKLSVLRGLGGTSSEARIDSNLGFKLSRRKGFRIEMMGLGLDLEMEPNPDFSQAAIDHEPVIQNVPLVSQAKPEKLASRKPKARVRFGDSLIENSSPHPVKNLGNTDW
ncbi:hypothetical protein O181_051651 [Austropuccinia psidii MF-1]|uniref:Elongator complex protein 4 n=1 Tax=Austropuccinia psidii MF-1 TaxID=1389203 RepID=A0A9Q3DWV4_9BASI|nr:hypothetical protein [Austropuccinia psidii MF-1]